MKEYFSELEINDVIFFFEVQNMNKAVHPMKVINVINKDETTIEITISSGRKLYFDKTKKENIFKINIGHAVGGYGVNIKAIKEEVKKYYDEQITFTKFKLSKLIDLRNKLNEK